MSIRYLEKFGIIGPIMTYLFFFAHPDDETVASASTIKQLIDNGDKVVVVSATDGAAGEVYEKAKSSLEKFGSVGALRRAELKQVAQFLNVTKLHILDFADGGINNQHVWGELKEVFIDLIHQYKPDVIITIDHSGWYFHLDHVGVSIAATLAYQQAEHKADAFFLSLFKVRLPKWQYVFPEELPVTHVVNATGHKELKLKAVDFHASQSMETFRQKLREEETHEELYQLAFASKKGKKIFANHPIFRAVTS